MLTDDQRKERFSHLLQQKRAHKQMAEEADDSPGTSTSTAAGFSGSVAVTAKAPKLETRTLLQKFLDGRKSETQPKVGFDSPVSEAQSQGTEQQELKRKVEGSIRVRTDLLTQSQGSHESTKKSSPRSPTSTSDEKDKNIVRVYIHKKFRRTESSSSYEPPPRPSVIVSPKMSKEEKKMIEVDEFSDVSDSSDWCNVSDTSEEELLDITSICELYFSDESTCTHLEATQKDFFAEWTLIPLGEEMMETYIDFCKGNIKMIGFPWMAIASSVVR